VEVIGSIHILRVVVREAVAAVTVLIVVMGIGKGRGMETTILEMAMEGLARACRLRLLWVLMI